MFSQQYRLRHEKDILRVVKSKRSVFDATCGVKFAPNQEGHPRFAIVIGTKIAKRAVVRNRVRRQYREICKKMLADLGAYDIVLLVSKPALTLPFSDKETQLKKVFAKARLYVSKPSATPTRDSSYSSVSKDTIV